MPQSTADEKTKWTIMLYIAADGLLANFGIESLKQVNRSIASIGAPGDKATVVVAAQLAIDAPGDEPIQRYIFNEGRCGTLDDSLVMPPLAPAKMTEKEALVSFLKWVKSRPECYASDKYALMLWGHGPEFLLQPPVADPTDVRAIRYLSPEQLREALEECFPETGLNIIGFDACSMSMFEMAYEIRESADYMLASQEEVPDLSFPYGDLITIFRRSGGADAAILKQGVDAYIKEYRDYVCNDATGMKQATLSALHLSKCDGLKKAVEDLAHALLSAKEDPKLPALLIGARSSSRDYAGGLYVDLVHFSNELKALVNGDKAVPRPYSHASGSLRAGSDRAMPLARLDQSRAIILACDAIIGSLQEDTKVPGATLLLANRTVGPDSNGVSLYFPYLSDAQNAVANQPMVKGGTQTMGGKEFPLLLNSASSGLLMAARRQIIVATEAYYGDLKLARDTQWYRFIQKQWSQILAQLHPDQLDNLYSAQQCAVNLSRYDEGGGEADEHSVKKSDAKDMVESKSLEPHR